VAPTDHSLGELLRTFSPSSREESRDLARLEALVGEPNPWDRSLPLHVTGSAIVVHPASSRVLLRWHERLQRWLQVGGHAEADDHTPYEVAAREATEETGLVDLAPWPDSEHPMLLQVIVVAVPAGKGEPAHEHGDLRFLLATADPSAIVRENDDAHLRWMPIAAAISEAEEESLKECLRRVARFLDSPPSRS
jgi:8-oxo-dGTP pyrophosphatase MutT (NUDIX family)